MIKMEAASPEEMSGYMRQWHRDGLIHIRGALDQDELLTALRNFDETILHTTSDGAGDRRHPSYTDIYSHSTRIRNAIGIAPWLGSFIDQERVFPILLNLMGLHPHVIGSEIFERRPHPEPMEGFHTDGGLSLREVFVTDESIVLQLKVQYFLTDVSCSGAGNFLYIPGSHRKAAAEVTSQCFIPEVNSALESNQLPEGTTEVLAAAGDAIIFPHSLWHAVGANISDRTRKSVILRYGQLWCRPIDYDSAPDTVLTRLTNRQRRLLGDFGDNPHPTDYYKPPNQEAIMDPRD